MAWPIHIDEETDSPESVEENVSSSTGHINEQQNGVQNIHAEGAAGLTPSHPHNLHDMRDFRVSNPYINRIRRSRRYSSGDINQNNAQQASGSNEINFGQRHFIPQFTNGRRYSLGDVYQSNVQGALGTNEINISQRHSVPCCHINPNVLHSCCVHLKRHLSLESLHLSRRNSFPMNCFHDPHSPDTPVDYTNLHTILNPHGQFPAYGNQTNGFGLNAEYERRRSFSISHSLLFGNENFQADRYVQQAISTAGHEFFMIFLCNEMDQRGLQLPEDMCRNFGQSGEMPSSFIYLIDRFSASVERQMIFCLALRVQFPLSLCSFVAILEGMNNGTAGPEKIVTLFFFCADLAIRALREGNDTLFREIVSWTRWYLRRCDTLVVPSKRSSYKIAATACFIGILAVIFLMKRN